MNDAQLIALVAAQMALNDDSDKDIVGVVDTAMQIVLTTYRRMAADAIDEVMESIGRTGRSRTKGLPLHAISGTGTFDFSTVANNPYLVLGLHYELLRADSKNDDGSFVQVKVLDSLKALLAARGPYAVIADEAHGIRNRKSPRAKLFMELGEHATHRWVLSGTPLRNYPRDMWPM